MKTVMLVWIGLITLPLVIYLGWIILFLIVAHAGVLLNAVGAVLLGAFVLWAIAGTMHELRRKP